MVSYGVGEGWEGRITDRREEPSGDDGSVNDPESSEGLVRVYVIYIYQGSSAWTP